MVVVSAVNRQLVLSSSLRISVVSVVEGAAAAESLAADVSFGIWKGCTCLVVVLPNHQVPIARELQYRNRPKDTHLSKTVRRCGRTMDDGRRMKTGRRVLHTVYRVSKEYIYRIYVIALNECLFLEQTLFRNELYAEKYSV